MRERLPGRKRPGRRTDRDSSTSLKARDGAAARAGVKQNRRTAKVAARPPEAGEGLHSERVSPEPSLAELRRRAAHRLRELSTALATLEQQTAEAAAECARLHANGTSGAVVAAKNALAVRATERPAREPAQLPVDLREALAENARLREELARLIGVLEEISNALDQSGPTR